MLWAARVRRSVFARAARFDCRTVPTEPDASMLAVYNETHANKAEVDAQLELIRQVRISAFALFRIRMLSALMVY